MKKLLIGLLTLVSVSAVAGEIRNAKGSKHLSLECNEIVNDSCREYKIVLNQLKDPQVEILAKVRLESIPSRADQIRLREKINNLVYFPLSNESYGPDGMIPNFGLGVVGAGLGFVALSALDVTLTPIGWGVAAAGLVIIASPAIADVVSLPVRAIIKGLKIRHANQSEKFAFNALRVLLSEDVDSELGNIRFNRVVKSFREITQF